jgi:hypothetical protein
MGCVCWLITRVATQLGVGVTAVWSIHHGIDPELRLPRPMNPVGDSIIQQQACHLQNEDDEELHIEE